MQIAITIPFFLFLCILWGRQPIVFCGYLNINRLFLVINIRLLVINLEIKKIASLDLWNEIDFTYEVIDKSNEAKCGFIKLNSYFCPVDIRKYE